MMKILEKICLLSLLTLTLGVFGQVPSYIPTDSLIGYWPMNNNANDVGSNAYHMNNSNVTFTTDRKGVSNAAAYFSGNSSSLYTKTYFKEFTGTVNQTYSIWFKNATNHWRYLLDYGNTSGSRFQMLPATRSTTKAITVSGIQGCNACRSGSAHTWPTGNSLLTGWHHIVIAIDKDSMKTYYDGVNLGTKSHSGFTCNDTAYRIYLASDIVCIPEYPNVYLDDLGIWNRTLSETEIKNIYLSKACTTTYSNDTITSCGPYNWTNGVTYTTDNITAKDTFTNAAGCDSIVTLNLKIVSQDHKQIGSDIDGEAIGDAFGISVSTSADGKIVAVGAPLNDGNGFESGHVRVYKNTNGTWTQVGSDIDGEAGGDRSGINICLSSDGNVLAIGAMENDGHSSRTGHVRVYKNTNGIWTQVGSDIDGEAGGDQSGTSVSLSSDGSIIAIGAWLNDRNGINSGHVRVYKNTNGIWTQVGSDIDGEAGYDYSGWTVSLSNDGRIVAIGGWGNDGNGTYAGHVRVYKNTNGTWTQVGSDIDGETAGDYSGWSVSLSGDGNTLGIGAYLAGDSAQGQVRVYKNTNGTWSQIGLDIDGIKHLDRLGNSVSLSSDGKTIAIGAYYSHRGDTQSGYVKVYKNVNGSWSQVGSEIAGEGAYDQFGRSVSLSSDGNILAIGGIQNRFTKSGHVRVYQVGTLNGVSYSTDTITSCGPYTWTDGKTYTTSNNTAKDTFVNAAGCDSIVSLNLIIGGISSNGLVGYWPFNGNLNDESGNGFHGTGKPNYITDRKSTINSAISLPSSTAIQLPSSVFQFGYNDTFSFSFWFTHEASGNARIFSTENSEGNFRIARGNGNGAYIIQFGSGYLYDTISFPKTWNHVVYVYENRFVKLYVNGNLKKLFNHTSNQALNYGVKAAIGVKASSLNNDKWIGKFDDLGIWNRSLSENEIASLYTSGTITYTIDTITSCGPYTWTNGVTYITDNTTARDTFISASGCDSIVTLNLQIIDNDILPDDTTLCDNRSIKLGEENTNFDTTGYIDAGSYNGYHYYFGRTLRSWTDARSRAINAGSDLAVIKDSSENAYIQSQISAVLPNTFQYIHLGLIQDTSAANYAEPAGGWYWLNGDSLTFKNWASSEPSNSATCTAGENYGIMWPSGKWNDVCPSQGGRGLVKVKNKFSSYLWSTGDTMPAITVNPDSSQTYWVEVSNGTFSCRDSIYITVLPSSYDTLTFLECDSVISPTGKVHTSTGSYNDTLVNSYGCDSVITSLVTIGDTISPTVLTQNLTLYLNQLGQVSTSSSDVNNGSSDNCGITSYRLSDSIFDCTDVGTNIIYLIVTDRYGNIDSASAVVTIQDTIKPTVLTQSVTVSLDANGAGSVALADIDNGSTDNCSIASRTLSKTSFDCSEVGANTIYLIVTDVNGNIDSASAVVTVQDIIKPTVVTTPRDTALGYCDATYTYAIPTGDDNCGVTVTQIAGLPPGSNFPVGITLNTFEISDPSGNTVTTSFTVDIRARYMPFATPGISICKNNNKINLSKGFDNIIFIGSGVEANEKFFNPNSLEPGSYSITAEFTDSMGCVSTEQFVIEIRSTPIVPRIKRVASDQIVTVREYNNYQWYRNGEELEGEDKQLLRVYELGIYSVLVGNDENCFEASEGYGFGIPVNEENVTNQGLVKVFPNPTRDMVFVQINDEVEFHLLTLADAVGNKLIEQETSTKVVKLDLTSLAPGTYYLNILGGTTNETVVIVKN